VNRITSIGGSDVMNYEVLIWCALWY